MEINPEQLREKHKNGHSYTLIDVREPNEHEDFNIGGDLIPMGEIAMALSNLQEHKDTEVVVYCQTGARSAAVKEFLVQSGFSKVRNLTGGIVSWKEKFGQERLD